MEIIICKFCDDKRGKRKCLIKNLELVCSLCCAKNRKAETCSECYHYEINKSFEREKEEKAFSNHNLGRAIKEAFNDLMDKQKTFDYIQSREGIYMYRNYHKI